MNINLNVLKHLGLHLYSNSVAVLSETVANAWDADASEMNIEIISDNEIIITDNGLGMSLDDINQRFLLVGYQRRDDNRSDAKKTVFGRSVMGRKGIGKLSLFSIAKIIEVYSLKENEELQALRMNTDEIESQIQRQNQSVYYPDPIAKEDQIKLPSSFTKGTIIRLTELKKTRMVSERQLRTRLARRFSLLGLKGFKVEVNNSEISASDRSFFRKLQYIWVFGADDYIKKIKEQTKDCKRFIEIDGGILGTEYKVQGWVGTADTPKSLVDDDAGNLNSIILLARGRPIHENILDEINDGRLYSKYLTGEIDADFLDADDQPDMATSSRQSLMEDDARYGDIKHFIKRTLDEIANNWTSFRNEDGEKDALNERPAILEWLNTFQASGDVRKSAGKLVAHIHSLPMDSEEDKTNLFKHGILAFERLKLKEYHEKLEQLTTFNSKQFGLIVDSVDEIEAGYYYEITNERLEIIKKLESLEDDNALEAELQKHIFEHMWLLDPGWERATGSAIMEASVKSEFGNISSLNPDEARGRLDIRYKKSAGSHVIVELKRSGRSTTVDELYRQGKKYYSALKKCLERNGEVNPHIEVIFLLGKGPKEDLDGEMKSLFATINARSITYREIIKSARMAYADYLEQHKKAGKLSKILEQIDILGN